MPKGPKTEAEQTAQVMIASQHTPRLLMRIRRQHIHGETSTLGTHTGCTKHDINDSSYVSLLEITQYDSI